MTEADSPTPNEDYFNMYNRWNLPLKTWVPNHSGCLTFSTFFICMLKIHSYVTLGSNLKCCELRSSFFDLNNLGELATWHHTLQHLMTVPTKVQETVS